MAVDAFSDLRGQLECIFVLIEDMTALIGCSVFCSIEVSQYLYCVRCEKERDIRVRCSSYLKRVEDIHS